MNKFRNQFTYIFIFWDTVGTKIPDESYVQIVLTVLIVDWFEIQMESEYWTSIQTIIWLPYQSMLSIIEILVHNSIGHDNQLTSLVSESGFWVSSISVIN